MYLPFTALVFSNFLLASCRVLCNEVFFFQRGKVFSGREGGGAVMSQWADLLQHRTVLSYIKVYSRLPEPH